MVTLTRSGAEVLAVVVEVQLRVDAKKRRSWPVYIATLHARLGCPVVLLALCPDPKVATWAAEPIVIGLPASRVTPMAFGPDRIPVVTDPGTARRLPELAVLSTLAHADRSDPTPLFEALVNAFDVIDSSHAALYHDFMLTALPAATRKLLEDYMTTTNYPFTSDFARRHYAAGEAEGKALGKAEAILAFLTARGIDVPERVRTTIVQCSDLDQLDEWIQRAATAEQVADLGGALID